MSAPAGGERLPLVDAGASGQNRGGGGHFGACTSRGVLLGIALSYGSLDVAMRVIFVGSPAPSTTSVAVCKAAFGTLLFVPALVAQRRGGGGGGGGGASDEVEGLFSIAVKLAFFNTASQELVYAGLARTSAAKAAFLLQLSVVFTPVFERVFLKRRQGRGVWVGVALAVAGVGLLSLPTGEQNASAAAAAEAQAAALGDGLVVVGAALWGWYLCLTSAVPADADATTVQAAKNLACFGFYVLFWLCAAAAEHLRPRDVARGWGSPTPWLLVVYCAAIPGALADVLQQKAQAAIRASEASLLLASEPLWAAVLALPALGEKMGETAVAGGALVFLGAVVSSGACPACPAGRLRVPSVAQIQTFLSTPDLRRVQIQEEGISLEARASDSFNLIESPTTSPSPLIAFPALLAKKA